MLAEDTPIGPDERVFLGLGANLGNREAHLKRALALLPDHGVQVLQASSLLENPPWGLTEQPPFVNQVVEVRCELPPMQLLAALQHIEEQVGRQRRQSWGPREVDLDILAMGTRQISTAHLTVPHPWLQERRFVLGPWAEIAPEFVVPGFNQTVHELLLALDSQAPNLA